MIKLEIIHNKRVLNIIKMLIKKSEHFGHTTLVVHESYGPVKGEYKEDHIGEERYLTFVLIEDEKDVGGLVTDIRKKLPHEKFICLKSKVEYTRI